MQWLHRGRQLGQAVKNVQRLRQIIAVFAKYGFVDIVQRMNLGKFLPGRLAAYAQSQAENPPPVRLRLAFEELGPTFVKLGQLLSTRPDVVPEAYLEEFTKLQDNVQPLPYETVLNTVERELGRRIEDSFASFERVALAAASIGQVHEATLRTGEKVVVKVQRPEIEKIIETDISLLAFLAGLLEKYVPETRVIGPRTVVEEFFRTLSCELDFVVEANNILKISANMQSFTEIVVPKVYKQLSSRKVLTLEKLDGIRVNDLKALEAAGIDRKKIVDIGARAFFKSVMIDGLFHGDLHGGNMFILPGNRLGIIDFGIVGRLSQKSRDQLANMVMSLLTEDYENLCYQYAELGNAPPSVDFEAFQRETRNALSPYLGLTLADMNIGRILIQATQIATRYEIKVPGDWMIVFKAILTIEGMGRTLDPEFDLLAAGQDMVRDLVKNQYSPERLTHEMAWIAKDAAAVMKVLPRQIRWMFRKLNANDFAIEVKSPELAGLRKQVDRSARRLSLSFITSALVLASAMSLSHTGGRMVGGYPLASVVLFAIATVFFVRMLIK